MQRPIMTLRSFLRTPSEAAGPGDEATIQDLVDTLEANRSRCVGMAANMIGVRKRIICVKDGNTKSITATASSSDSFGARCSPPPLRGWSSRLRCNYIATAMTSFFMCTGGVGVLSGVGVPCAGRLASLRGGVMLPAVGWLASLEVLSASVMCQRVAGWLR